MCSVTKAPWLHDQAAAAHKNASPAPERLSSGWQQLPFTPPPAALTCPLSTARNPQVTCFLWRKASASILLALPFYRRPPRTRGPPILVCALAPRTSDLRLATPSTSSSTWPPRVRPLFIFFFKRTVSASSLPACFHDGLFLSSRKKNQLSVDFSQDSSDSSFGASIGFGAMWRASVVSTLTLLTIIDEFQRCLNVDPPRLS